MKILITGASGLIGQALQKSFKEKGYEMLLASRKDPTDDKHIKWSIEDGFAEPDKLEGVDVVVHLAGENVSGLRWTDEKKKAIRDSRVLGTRNVVDAISKLKTKPKTFIASSAIGFYGERGEEEVTESSAAGDNFLAGVSKEWEAESRRAEDAGIRTVLLRTGIVLSKEGGALGTMLMPFKLGVGGVVGSGKQWMSWISREDWVGAVHHALQSPDLSGPVNLTAPEPVTNATFPASGSAMAYRRGVDGRGLRRSRPGRTRRRARGGRIHHQHGPLELGGRRTFQVEPALLAGRRRVFVLSPTIRAKQSAPP